MARALTTLLTTWRFPALALSLLGGFSLAMLILLLLPTSGDGMGQFAEDFKVWCFGYDPATGSLQWHLVGTAVVEPLMLAALIVGVWWGPLRDGVRGQRRSLLRWSGGGLVAAMIIAGSMLFSVEPALADGDLPFPAEDLRTAQTPPAFRLIDQDGRPATLDDARGKVVLLTAVYASCGSTCPMLMAQARRAVAALTPEQRADLRVMGITLDPAHDTPEQLAQMARVQRLEAPLWRLLTGEPAEVDRVLDRFDVSRRRNPETGVIEHANLFLLIDRQGRIAYRLGLGETQERWLSVALALLIDEPE